MAGRKSRPTKPPKAGLAAPPTRLKMGGHGRRRREWITGTSPVMTVGGWERYINRWMPGISAPPVRR
jgi:hypothetical protein